MWGAWLSTWPPLGVGRMRAHLVLARMVGVACYGIRLRKSFARICPATRGYMSRVGRARSLRSHRGGWGSGWRARSLRSHRFGLASWMLVHRQSSGFLPRRRGPGEFSGLCTDWRLYRRGKEPHSRRESAPPKRERTRRAASRRGSYARERFPQPNMVATYNNHAGEDLVSAHMTRAGRRTG